jgi:uncharacterized protein (DUF427 family)
MQPLKRANWRGALLAESNRTVEYGGYTYFPRSAVRMHLLHVADKSESDRACPHGVQFYDIVADGARAERIAWSYEAPGPAMEHIAHWIGFWAEAKVA